MGKYNFTLVIPSLDPDERLAATVRSAVDAGIDDIILVDDGSREECRKIFLDLDREFSTVTLLNHEKNLGKGAALKTAFTYFLARGDQRCGVVTADGDGQHKTEDIIACAEEMERTENVILGCRDFSLDNVPKKSRFGNKTTSFVFRLFCGMKISDTQTGLRAIPARYIKDMLNVSGSRYEFETNMLLYMGQNDIPYSEVKISTVYYDNNSASHFRPIVDSIRVYGLILKYVASSMFASAVDIVMFFLFGQFVFNGGGRLDVLLTTACARVISSAVNFMTNRKLVFKSRAGTGKTLVRYICVAFPVMLASWLIVYLLSELLALIFGVEAIKHIGRTAVKIPVDAMLFFVSFRAQRKWVFAEKNESRR